MTIQELISDLRIITTTGDTQRGITGLQFDSRKIEPGQVFVAIQGKTSDGNMFIDKAVDRGAIGIITDRPPDIMPKDVCVVIVDNAAKALAMMACTYYGHPSRQMTMVAVTGTNGKTTVATLLYRLFSGLGYKCGLLSTVENRIGDRVEVAGFTTPDAITVQRALAEMVEAGCTHAFMEASSHALDQHRVTGIDWAVAVFTNLTHDHLDYHGDFKSYIRAKKILFDGLSAKAHTLLNIDDRHAEVMVEHTVSKVSNYSLTKMADFRARVIENRIDGLQMEINDIPVHMRLVGKFNAYNLLAIYASAVLLGEDKQKVLTVMSTLTPAEGRFDVVTGNKPVSAIVDYAHTPDALQNVLSTIQQVKSPQSRILCVVGCGGDRDKTKRPEMARIAVTLADQAILTSDNPRTESPESILDDMWAGVPDEMKSKSLRITDRREAIRAAVQMARPGDVILVAGKGHEKYQEINGHRYSFDDKQVLAEALA